MVHCIAFGCKNKDEASKKGISFFRLPKDIIRRRIWLQSLRLKNPPDTDNVRVCSEHFKADSYVRDMQAELGFKRKVRRLTAEATPSVFVFSKEAKSRDVSIERIKRTEKQQVCYLP